MDLMKILRELRANPRKHLEHLSFERLNCFIGGFTIAQMEHGDSSGIALMQDFSEWLRLLFGVDVPFGGFQALELFSDDDAHAVQMNWELFDRFIEQRRPGEKARCTSKAARRDGLTLRLTGESTVDNAFGNILNKIRESPRMYVGARSAARVGAFLRGFAAAHGMIGNRTYQHILSDFDRWVRQRYAMRASHAAESIIVFTCGGDDGPALDAFWSLVDEFRQPREGGEAALSE